MFVLKAALSSEMGRVEKGRVREGCEHQDLVVGPALAEALVMPGRWHVRHAVPRSCVGQDVDLDPIPPTGTAFS